MSKAAWEKILANEIFVPLISVREFDENGDLLSLRSVQTNFDNMENELQPLDCSVIEPEIQHNMSSMDESIPLAETQRCTVMTSTPTRGSSAHKQLQDAPCSSNYDDQDGFYEHPDCTDGNDCTTDSQVEQDCIGVQLVLQLRKLHLSLAVR